MSNESSGSPEAELHGKAHIQSLLYGLYNAALTVHVHLPINTTQTLP